MIHSIVSVVSRNLCVHGYEDDPDVSRDNGLRPTKGNKKTRRKKKREIRQKSHLNCACQVVAGPGDRMDLAIPAGVSHRYSKQNIFLTSSQLRAANMERFHLFV